MPLTVTVSGTGSVTSNPAGIDTAAGNNVAYFSGSVQLTAASTGMWQFASWSGDCSGTGNPTTVTVDAAKACTALFVSGDAYHMRNARYYSTISDACNDSLTGDIFKVKTKYTNTVADVCSRAGVTTVTIKGGYDDTPTPVDPATGYTTLKGPYVISTTGQVLDRIIIK